MSSEDVERGDGDDGFERFERLGRGLGASRARRRARTRETEATDAATDDGFQMRFDFFESPAARAAKRELSASCATSSAATKMTCATLVLGCAARKMVIGEKTFDAAFALEAYATTRKPWTLVTSGYVERSFAALVVDCWGLLYIGGILEPVWGAKELTRFVVGVNLATTTLAWLSMCALYALSAGDEFYLFAKFSGFHGVLAALLLALRQTSPEEPVFAGEGALGAGTSGVVASLRALRNKHLIGAYLCFTAAYAFMSGGAHHHVGLYLFDIWGAYSAWVYSAFLPTARLGRARGRQRRFRVRRPLSSGGASGHRARLRPHRRRRARARGQTPPRERRSGRARRGFDRERETCAISRRRRRRRRRSRQAGIVRRARGGRRRQVQARGPRRARSRPRRGARERGRVTVVYHNRTSAS